MGTGFLALSKKKTQKTDCLLKGLGLNYMGENPVNL